MKEKIDNKLTKFDQRISKVIRIIGYAIFVPLALVLFFFLIINILVSPSVRGDHTSYTKPQHKE